MAVDEWLLSLGKPILRVYQWKGEWGSLGYFGSLSAAQSSFPEINQWVRRWTGGGTVDHRSDWPYTLVMPSTGDDQRLGGAESYRSIHQALAEAIGPEGLEVKLSGGEAETGHASCFDNPVTHDLVDGSAHKIAGAGQKRTQDGLLHQGSVALPVASPEQSRTRAQRLAEALSGGAWSEVSFEVPAEAIEEATNERYGQDPWTQRRP
ncbi:MAG: hypothetical protein R3242_10500 [Akkermansiaceae bacterium]|nr:hypothetical protein [Akkermansiaceae bacterium]